MNTLSICLEMPFRFQARTDKTNKGFQQRPICRNPLFSAVFPIFCSYPLYQISGLHFHIIFAVKHAVLFCVIFQQ